MGSMRERATARECGTFTLANARTLARACGDTKANTFYLTGNLTCRKMLLELIGEQGWTVSRPTRDTTWCIVGRNPGSGALLAKRLDVVCLTEDEALTMLLDV